MQRWLEQRPGAVLAAGRPGYVGHRVHRGVPASRIPGGGGPGRRGRTSRSSVAFTDVTSDQQPPGGYGPDANTKQGRDLRHLDGVGRSPSPAQGAAGGGAGPLPVRVVIAGKLRRRDGHQRPPAARPSDRLSRRPGLPLKVIQRDTGNVHLPEDRLPLRHRRDGHQPPAISGVLCYLLPGHANLFVRRLQEAYSPAPLRPDPCPLACCHGRHHAGLRRHRQQHRAPASRAGSRLRDRLRQVPWTAADWAAHPGAVRIDQDTAASDRTADVLDVETGAATIAECAPWAKSALADWRAGTRPGQRTPAIYASEASVTHVANALNAGGVTSGVGLWIANWNLDQAQAEALVTGASGPFPVIGVQFRDAGAYDVSVVSTAWLDAISGKPGTVPAGRTNVVVTRLPPGDWKPGGR